VTGTVNELPLKHLISRILLTANILLALALLLTYASVHVSPAKMWVFAFIGMAYPFVLFLNVLFVLFWAAFRKWYFILSLVCIVTGWNTFQKYKPATG